MYCSNVPLLSSAAGYRSLGRHLPSVVEVRRRVFDVHLKSWGNGQRTGLVIEGQMFSLFGEKGCLEAMMSMSSTMIGLPRGHVQDFNRELGVEAAAKTLHSLEYPVFADIIPDNPSPTFRGW